MHVAGEHAAAMCMQQHSSSMCTARAHTSAHGRASCMCHPPTATAFALSALQATAAAAAAAAAVAAACRIGWARLQLLAHQRSLESRSNLARISPPSAAPAALTRSVAALTASALASLAASLAARASSARSSIEDRETSLPLRERESVSDEPSVGEEAEAVELAMDETEVELPTL